MADQQQGISHCTLHEEYEPTCAFCRTADRNLRAALGIPQQPAAGGLR